MAETSVGVTVISAVVGYAISIALAGGQGTVGYTAPTAPASINSADDLGQYVRSRSIWGPKPTLFKSSLDLAFKAPSDNAPSLAAVGNGTAIGYSASDLISQGATRSGQPVYVVGRIAGSVASPVGTDNWNLTEKATDIHVVGPSGSPVVYALVGSNGDVTNGHVVYFRAVVAAIGQTTAGLPTVYLIGLDDPQLTSGLDNSVTSVPDLARKFGPAAGPAG